ncbi:hypothetical protein MRB53_004687 [Persea americana]|uniref:Uncharacterized protein n=1 Tax=Persea americana TaxID=3435 RepID=A0ACC2MB48_PERAE|nr:hypothetical protein MRB53_004687 [Persea americana]
MHHLLSLSASSVYLRCTVPIHTPITANAMDPFIKRLLKGKLRTEKKDDPAIKIGFFSVGDDDCSSAVGGVTRRNSWSKNPSTNADADSSAGVGAENQPPKLPRRRRGIIEKFFDYLNTAAACIILFILFKDWMRISGTGGFRDNLRSWLIGPRETETSYDDESKIASRKILREAFENSFRKMYGLPKEMVALPPMPDDGDHWSIQHCWAMPTPSFLEFIMFSRMFVDSVDSFNHNSKVSRTCLLASTTSEVCYLDLALRREWRADKVRPLVHSWIESRAVHMAEQAKLALE